MSKKAFKQKKGRKYLFRAEADSDQEALEALTDSIMGAALEAGRNGERLTCSVELCDEENVAIGSMAHSAKPYSRTRYSTELTAATQSVMTRLASKGLPEQAVDLDDITKPRPGSRGRGVGGRP